MNYIYQKSIYKYKLIIKSLTIEYQIIINKFKMIEYIYIFIYIMILHVLNYFIDIEVIQNNKKIIIYDRI